MLARQLPNACRSDHSPKAAPRATYILLLDNDMQFVATMRLQTLLAEAQEGEQASNGGSSLASLLRRDPALSCTGLCEGQAHDILQLPMAMSPAQEAFKITILLWQAMAGALRN